VTASATSIPVQIGGPGQPNIIHFNTGAGIWNQAASANVRVLANSISGNGGLGIDVGAIGVTANAPADGIQNFPVITEAVNYPGPNTKLTLDLLSFDGGLHEIHFYASATCDAFGYGEGQRHVGSGVGFSAGAPIIHTLGELVTAGEYITAVAINAAGNSSEFSACVQVDETGAAVLNTNDTGPGSLHAAINYANNRPGTQTITFDIPGVTPATPAIINISTALPAITQPVHIEGSTQPGWDAMAVVEVRGPGAGSGIVGFYLNSSGVRIRGLSITNFTEGIFAFQTFSGHLIEDNLIGTNRTFAGGLGNARGIAWRAGSSTIRGNVISGNGEGLNVILGAANNSIESNKIGMSRSGTTAVPNSGHGVTMYDGAATNTFTGNMISGNGGWGVDIQHGVGLAPVTGTVFVQNTVGLDAGGNDAGNAQGGIRVNNGPDTKIGMAGAGNVISGNGSTGPNVGPGILIEGNAVPMPVIRGNLIGLDPTGLLARGNHNKGVVLVSPAVIGGTESGAGNHISGNGATDAAGAGVIANLGAGGSTIIGNIIGLNTAGASVGNGYAGITVASVPGITVGGTAPWHRNVISGNGQYGISVLNVVGADPAPTGTVIEGNYIGTDLTGTVARANGSGGINVKGSGHRIGSLDDAAVNRIAFNGGPGVRIFSGGEVDVDRNEIHDNVGLGIDHNGDGVTLNGTGPQNYPVLSNAATLFGETQVDYDLTSFAAGTYVVRFYSSPTCDASGFGEGLTFRGVTSFGPGAVGSLLLGAVIPSGHAITATATKVGGTTSEFSNCAVVP
jgi:hypothetical protein